MFSKPRTSIYDMRLPQNRGEVLRGASNRGHGESLSVFVSWIIEIVFALTEINKLELIFLSDKDVRGLDVTVADTFALQERARRD